MRRLTFLGVLESLADLSLTIRSGNNVADFSSESLDRERYPGPLGWGMGRGSHKKEIHVEYPQTTHISQTASIEELVEEAVV